MDYLWPKSLAELDGSLETWRNEPTLEKSIFAVRSFFLVVLAGAGLKGPLVILALFLVMFSI